MERFGNASHDDIQKPMELYRAYGTLCKYGTFLSFPQSVIHYISAAM